ncbi:sugar phosphate isomerase/epimerase [Dyadobacter sp. CY343]|uniref:sugar phosphate isomerase/epimerase family protein n=1 Tax=Dyadobacter sp. CY343 TaxID=2907299 RepID=UPI001F46CF1E|nr:sugar phosphate isomerase/epimerase [Dyadobacter sp. CY343]MCE7060752.1 sugar phosphate isomerase/epimerase [Dyadobacter sp. CY343]
MKLRNLLLIALTIAAADPLFAQSGQPLFPQMPGMVSYTYRASFAKDVAATLDTLQQLGIKDMEFSNLFGKTAAELRKLLDERDMQCSSFGVSYDEALNKTMQVGENAKTLGAKFVRVAWIPHVGPFTLELADKTIADFNTIGATLKDEFGVSFCYHNHGYEFEKYKRGTLMDYIIQKSDPNYVNFELDLLWAFFPGGDPAKLLRKYPTRFKLMHMKDLRKGVEGNLSGGTPVTNDVALGTGQLNIPEILKAAKKSAIEHYYIEDESPSYATQVPQTIAYLKSLTY